MHRRLFPLLLIAPALAACGKTESASAPPTAPGATDGAAVPKAPEVGIAPGNRIPAFTAAGTTAGAPTKVESQAPGAVTVYCAGSTTCPYTNKYAAKMKDIETAYTSKGVKFVWLYPNRSESDADKQAWHAEKGLAGNFVIDRDAAIAKALGVERTPELVVTSADGTITYRGAFDDGAGDPVRAKSEHLKDALEATLAGKPVAVSRTTPAG